MVRRSARGRESATYKKQSATGGPLQAGIDLVASQLRGVLCCRSTAVVNFQAGEMEGVMSAGGDGNELLSLLQRCQTGISWEERLNIGRELLTLVESQRVRDDVVDKLPVKIYSFLVASIRLGWQQPGEKYAQACWTGLVGLPEFEVAVAEEVVDEGFLAELCARFQAGVADERVFLRDTLHWAYASFPQKRRLLRDQIGAVLGSFVRAPSRNFHISELLQVLQLIIKGFPSSTNVRALS